MFSRKKSDKKEKPVEEKLAVSSSYAPNQLGNRSSSSLTESKIHHYEYRETRSFSLTTNSNIFKEFKSEGSKPSSSLVVRNDPNRPYISGAQSKLPFLEYDSAFRTASAKPTILSAIGTKPIQNTKLSIQSKTDAKPFISNLSERKPVVPNYNRSTNYQTENISTGYLNSLPPISTTIIKSIEKPTIFVSNEELKKQSPLKIKVKKTGKRYDNTPSVIPTYKTNSKKRGKVLIVNNVKFIEEKEYRHGAEVDEKNVKELFKQLGFEVTFKRDVKSKEITSLIENFTKSSSWTSVDICAVVMMSHGTQTENGNTEIICADGIQKSTEEIIQKFTSINCTQLQNKPKIFIFQCCRGNQKDTLQTDARVSTPRNCADMLIAHSTVPGYASHRDPKTGTWYIQTLCKVFSEHAHEYDVENLLKIVDQELSGIHPSTRQTTSYENRGFKRCFLHP